MMVAPFIWMVLTSFKPLSQLLTDPLSALPDPWIFTNWPDAWNALPFGRAYLNSFYITVLVVAGTLLTTSMAAYGFSRLPFKGSKVIFGIFLAMQMVPKQVTLVPFYFLMAKIGWVDSHLALIVPAILVNPFGVFLMRQFIASIPRELEEAAMIDGASRWRIYRAVHRPAAAQPVQRAVRRYELRHRHGRHVAVHYPDAHRLPHRPAPDHRVSGHLRAGRALSDGHHLP